MQNVGAYNETFENRDKAVETEHQAKPPLVVPAESHREDGTDESDHASKGWDDLKQAA